MTRIRKLVGGNRPNDFVEHMLMWGAVSMGVVIELRLVVQFMGTIHNFVLQGSIPLQ